MDKELINGLLLDNPLPLHIVVIAEWYDTSPSIRDETVVFVIRHEDDNRIDDVMGCLLANKNDYDWKLITEKEHDANVIDMVQEHEGTVDVYHHIAAAYIKTERLKNLVEKVLKDPS